MILEFSQEVKLLRVTDAQKGTMEPVALLPGRQSFIEIPNPTSRTGQSWLVLEGDRTVGMAKQALLMKPGVCEVKPAPDGVAE